MCRSSLPLRPHGKDNDCEAPSERSEMTSSGRDHSYVGSSGEGQPSWLSLPETSRRRKLAGYFQAAKELRQTYQDTVWNQLNNAGREGWEMDENLPGAYPEASIVRSGNEQMVLFPSYARKHIKRKPRDEPENLQQSSGAGRDARESIGAGDAEFWREQWEKYEDDHAVVDVDVRGWIFSPHKGPMSRKQRLFIGLARQLAGLPAPATQNTDASSHLHTAREKLQETSARRDDEAVAQEAESILRKGEAEADAAARGAYSERPKDADEESLSDARSRTNSPGPRKAVRGDLSPLAQVTNADAAERIDPMIKPLQKPESWNQPADMSPAELKLANSHLMQRLKPFLSVPLPNTAISAFFYNDDHSQQRTIYTDASGHFNFRAPLEFVPTHVRILASEDLSATEEIIITEPRGVSLISDIDDTIKHSAIGSGAREIFRNAFIRDLDDLVIDGVKQWYSHLANMGVKFHYVSNSPWQLYPVLMKYFSLAGLPAGSFHLKQYSGMLQGIFEPVAERKKGTLDRLARDFPERRFILVGDSGEADIEVYTDFVLENPGRVLGVFIRDVTTSHSKGFFTPSNSSSADVSSRGSPRQRSSPAVSPHRSPDMSAPLGAARTYGNFTRNGLAQRSSTTSDDEDADLQAAIKASLKDMEEEENQIALSASAYRALPDRTLHYTSDKEADRPPLPQRRPTGPAATETGKMEPPMGNLIDLNDDEGSNNVHGHPLHPTKSVPETVNSHGIEELVDSSLIGRRHAPPPPRKPVALRQSSNERQPTNGPSSTTEDGRATPKIAPPKPRRPSTAVGMPHSKNSSSLSRECNQSSVTSGVGQSLSTAYNNLPEIRSHLPSIPLARAAVEDAARKPAQPLPNIRSQSHAGNSRRPPPLPPPTRRGVTSYPAAAAQYASNRLSGFYNYYDGPPSTPPSGFQSQRFSTLSNTPRSDSLARAAAGNGRGSSQPGVNNDSSFRSEYLDQQSQLSKKEALWQQRLTRASHILRDKGVFLKIWRVGGDAEKPCVELVEEALQREEEGKGPKP